MGICQQAITKAQGMKIYLYDRNQGKAKQHLNSLMETLKRDSERGKYSEGMLQNAKDSISLKSSLADFENVDFVIEVIRFYMHWWHNLLCP